MLYMYYMHYFFYFFAARKEFAEKVCMSRRFTQKNIIKQDPPQTIAKSTFSYSLT